MNAMFSRKVSLIAVLVFCGVLANGRDSKVLAEHHVPGRMEPYTNCRLCHGDTLQGLIGRSCYICHGRLWPGGEMPPLADAGGPYIGQATLAVQFDGSNSVDPDGAILEYLWDFGDGTVDTGVRPTHAFESEGDYVITLMVTDDLGLTDVATTAAEIGRAPNQSPIADSGGSYTGSTGTPVQFDGSGSEDPNGSIVSYAWDFGDGATGEGVDPTHTYATAGVFTVALTVTDDEGATGSDETVVFITASANSPPIVDAGGPYVGVVGRAVQFDASGTVDPDGDALIYQWLFGDGSTPQFPSQEPTASHVYTAPGTYTAQLTVLGGASMPTIAETTVEITDGRDPDLPPSAGDLWAVRVGMTPIELLVSFQSVDGFLLVQTTHGDGTISMGVGIEANGMILWLDAAGTVFFGNVDDAAGTMMGMVIDPTIGTSVWAAERL